MGFHVSAIDGDVFVVPIWEVERSSSFRGARIMCALRLRAMKVHFWEAAGFTLSRELVLRW